MMCIEEKNGLVFVFVYKKVGKCELCTHALMVYLQESLLSLHIEKTEEHVK